MHIYFWHTNLKETKENLPVRSLDFLFLSECFLSSSESELDPALLLSDLSSSVDAFLDLFGFSNFLDFLLPVK